MLHKGQKDGRSLSNLFKKTAVTICLGATLTFTTTSVFAADNNKLTTVYHVYVNDEHIGKVNNQAVVEKVEDKKVSKEQDKSSDYKMVIGQDVSLVPEMVFEPHYNNDKVADYLSNELAVKAEAVAIKAGDKTAGYYKDQETAEKVLKAYKEKYVKPEDLKKLEAQREQEKSEKYTHKQTDHPDLAVGESVLLDVSLSKDISFEKEKVAPGEILTEKQGVELLEKGTLKEEPYKVKDGDVLGSIANKHDMTTEELLKLNPDLDEDALLHIDQEIKVTAYKPFVDVTVKKEERAKETIKHKTETVDSDDMYKGEEKVKQEGKDGEKQVQYAVELKNGKVVSKKKTDEKVTDEAVNKIVIKGTKVISSRGTGNLSWPAVGGYVSSGMGHRWGTLHKGIDIAGPSSRDILAADNGVVVSAGWNSGGYGNRVVINHNNGMKTTYNHMNSIQVHAGQTVRKGSKLGVMGQTGFATGIHLHFEVYQDGALQNPMKYF